VVHPIFDILLVSLDAGLKQPETENRPRMLAKAIDKLTMIAVGAVFYPLIGAIYLFAFATVPFILLFQRIFLTGKTRSRVRGG